MRTREVQRLAAMVACPPRVAPRWLTPEMVVQATPLDGLDLFARMEMRDRRMALLLAICRAEVIALRKYVNQA